MTGCRPENAPASTPSLPPVVVRVQAIQSRPYLATEEVVGTVHARLRAAVEAKVSGRVERMLVTQGQSVHAGELIAQLDARELQSRLESALAVREQTESDLKRLRSLLASAAISPADFDAAQARQRVAGAAVQEAETMLSHARVTAPFAGVITRKLADVGDLATPGKPLVELEDPGALRLEADVPEALIERVRPGDKLTVRVLAMDPGVDGVVSEIAPAADPASRTFLVKFDLPSATHLRSGQFARVAVPVGESSTLRVPAGAVVQRGQLEIVFVETNRTAQLRLVKTGRRHGDEVELVSGLEAGERVVIDGAIRLRDGQPVEVK